MADLVNQFGQVVTVPDEQVDQALREGFSPASADQVGAAQRKSEYDTVGHMAGALGTGLMSGATLGLSDVAISSLGGKETLQAYDEQHGGIRTAGEIGGALFGAGKFGGAGLASKALRGLSSPARFAIRAGEGAERLVGGRAIGAITRGAVEGGLFGVGQGAKELALSDDPVTGEKIAAALSSNMTMGALYGGAIGGGLYGAGKAASSVGKKLIGAGEGGVSNLVKAWDKTSAAIGASERGAIEKMFSRGRSGVRNFELAGKADDVIAHAGDDVYRMADDVMSAHNTVAKNFKGRLKGEQVDRVVSRGNEAQVYGTSKAFVADVRSSLDDMLDNGVEYGRQGSLKKLSKKLDDVERKIDFANSVGDEAANRKAFMQLDEFKRDIGKHTGKAKRSRNTTSEVARTGDALESLYEKSRSFLQDVDTWGGAGSMQKRMNAPWANQIQADSDFIRTIASRKSGKWGVSQLEVDREKVGRYVASLSDPNASQTHAGLKTWLDSTQEFADAALDSMHLSPVDRKAVEKLATTTKAMRGRLDDAAEAIQMSHQLKSLGKEGDMSAVFGNFGGAVGGGLLGGAPGAVIGAAGSALSNPAGMIRKVAAVSRLVGSVDRRMAGGVKGFLSRSAKKVRTGTARYSQPAAAFAEKKNRYAKRQRELRHLASNKEAASDAVSTAMAPVSEAFPSAAEYAARQLEKRNDFLLSKIPMGAVGASGFGGEPSISLAEMEKFLRYDDLATNPMKLPELLNRGKLTADHVEAVREVWPALFSEMQDQAMSGLAELEANGKSMPYQKRLQLGHLLDIPAHRSMRPEMIQVFQQGYQAGEAAGAPPTPASGGRRRKIELSLSDAFKTDEDRLIDDE